MTRQPTVQLTAEPQRPPEKSGWLHLSTPQKALAITAILALIWIRSLRRKKKSQRICSVCNAKNPPHLTNCAKCHAPLFGS